MSGVVKSVGKIFKKVIKTVKKLAPVILGAAAIYFTAGAALGIAGTAGGWGGAVSGLVGRLGLGSTLSSVLTGGMTQAGYGAVLGAATSAVTGGDVSKGALTGALTGAATGGLLGGLGVATDPFKGIGETAAGSTLSGGTGADTLVGGAGPPSNLGFAGSIDNAAELNPSTITNATSGATTPPPGNGLLSNLGKFITNNQELVGGAIKGIGAGIGGFAEADATIEAAKIRSDQEAKRRAEIAGNFGTGGGGGLLSNATPDDTVRPTPQQQFNPANRFAQNRGARWWYNPESGRIELTDTA